MTINFSIQDIEDNQASHDAWDNIVDSSPDAWVWLTRDMHNARKVFMDEVGTPYIDRSFFVKHDDKIVGLMPLLIAQVTVSGDKFKTAAYGAMPLPWPCFSLSADLLMEAEMFAFSEAENRARQEQASGMSYMLSPPLSDEDNAARFSNIVTKLHYLDASYQSHLVIPVEGVLDNVRSRYGRYVKKFNKGYDVFTVTGPEVTDELVEIYRNLHEKDAGGVVRTPRTYFEQARMSKTGKGFWTVARHKENGKIVGILQIMIYKNNAYDSSVGVDPDYQDDQISHLLKWHTIEKLIKDRAEAYELGEKASLARRNKIYSSKNFGISFFKEGWSRGNLKTVYAVEKFLDKDYLDAMYKQDALAVAEYSGLNNNVVKGENS